MTINGTIRVGCVFRPQFAPERLPAVARAADQSGLDELWLFEDCFLTGGLTTAAVALSNSSRLTVSVGLLPIPMRNVAATAMEIATLARLFPGRTRIGVGHGVQDWMAQIGASVESPMTLMREYLTCLTALLRGEDVTFHGRYVDLAGVRLDWPPDHDSDILLGATGPRTLQLSGELASGTVITGGTSPTELRSALEQIRTGSVRRESPAAHSVAAYIMCTTGPQAYDDLQAEIARWEFDPSKDIGVYGDASAIADGAKRWVAAGADTVVLQPTTDVNIEEFVAFIGAEVQPRIKAD